MVQHFLQSQFTPQLNLRLQILSLDITQAFRRSHPTARNIVQWEKESFNS